MIRLVRVLDVGREIPEDKFPRLLATDDQGRLWQGTLQSDDDLAEYSWLMIEGPDTEEDVIDFGVPENMTVAYVRARREERLARG